MGRKGEGGREGERAYFGYVDELDVFVVERGGEEGRPVVRG